MAVTKKGFADRIEAMNRAERNGNAAVIHRFIAVTAHGSVNCTPGGIIEFQQFTSILAILDFDSTYLYVLCVGRLLLLIGNDVGNPRQGRIRGQAQCYRCADADRADDGGPTPTGASQAGAFQTGRLAIMELIVVRHAPRPPIPAPSSNRRLGG